MAFTPKTGKMTWSRSTPNDGDLFETEFNKVFDNTDYLKAEVEANDADIAANANNIATNTSNIVANTTDILNNKIYDYVVKNQDDFNNMFTRISANTYKINDQYKSIYIRLGTYAILNLITIYGDTSCNIQTNNCRSITCAHGALIYYAGIDGYIEMNTPGSVYRGIQVAGDTSSITSTYTILISANSDVALYDCGTASRHGGFYVTSSNKHTVKFFNCNTYNLGGVGFNNCDNLVNCYATQCTSAGFANCNKLSNCFATYTANGFSICKEIVSCTSENNSGEGFYACKRISCSSSKNNGSYGFTSCTQITGCESIGNTVGGYSTCEQISSSYANNNSFLGFEFCRFLDSSCRALGNPTNYRTYYGVVNEQSPSGSMANAGDPLFTKFSSGVYTTQPIPLPYVTILHGIPGDNAYTNKRIIEHGVYTDYSGSLYGVSSSDTGKPLHSRYTETNIIITLNVPEGTTVYAYIVYR